MQQQLKTIKKDTKAIGTVGKLIITEPVQKYIDQLHAEVGNTEWSGMLFYKTIKGKIEDLKDIEFETVFLYPMDIGSSTYTEFNYNQEILNAYDLCDEALEVSRALVHSHAGMAAFFSGTDTTELEDNSEGHNYYLSLIVNFSGDYKCKVAIPSKTTQSFKSIIKNTQGELVEISKSEEKDIILIGDIDVVRTKKYQVTEWLTNRILQLKEKKKQDAKKIIPGKFDFDYHRGDPYRHFYDKFDKYDKFDDYIKPKKTNTVTNFLATLLALDTSDPDIALVSVIQSLNKEFGDNDLELEIYAESLFESVEIVFNEMLGKAWTLEGACVQALTILERNKDLFLMQEVYDVIHKIINMYAKQL